MRRRRYILAGVVLLLVLHHDFWNWNSMGVYLGVPAGLMFHLLICLSASVLFTLLVWAGHPTRPLARHRPHKNDSP